MSGHARMTSGEPIVRHADNCAMGTLSAQRDRLAVTGVIVTDRIQLRWGQPHGSIDGIALGGDRLRQTFVWAF